MMTENLLLFHWTSKCCPSPAPNCCCVFGLRPSREESRVISAIGPWNEQPSVTSAIGPRRKKPVSPVPFVPGRKRPVSPAPLTSGGNNPVSPAPLNPARKNPVSPVSSAPRRKNQCHQCYLSQQSGIWAECGVSSRPASAHVAYQAQAQGQEEVDTKQLISPSLILEILFISIWRVKSHAHLSIARPDLWWHLSIFSRS